VNVDLGGTLGFSNLRWWAPAALLLAAGALLLVLGHRRAPAGWWALGLRGAGLLLLCLCLLEPSWTTRHAKPGANLFVVLADNSKGMSLHDRGAARSRGEVLREQLAGPPAWQARLAETFQVRRYLFDARLRRTQDFHELAFDGQASQIGGALRTIADRYRGGPLAGVLLLSDGNATDLGDEPFDGRGLPPVYPVVVGGRDPQPDLALGAVNVAQTAFEDAPVTITADVDAVGQGGRTITADLLDEAGVVAQSQALAVNRDEEVVTARFRLRPAKAGLSFYRVRIAAVPGEATLANNSRQVLVERPPGPYRVLYVSGRPNWDYKFLRRALESDSAVQLVALVRVALREPRFSFRGRDGESSNPLYRGFGRQDADEVARYDQPVLVRLGTRDANELAGGFPRSAEELFAYHALVLDDVEATFFDADQLALIERFVSDRGGGFLMMGGQESFRQGHYERTPLARVLPVYLDSPPAAPPPGAMRFALSREGWLEPWTRLRDNEAGERDRLARMAGFRVLNPVRGAKPGATVLGTVSTEGGASYPALVVQRFGTGRAGAFTVGDVWRWALGRVELQPDLGKFWRQTTRWLVTDVPERVALRVERRPAESGQPVVLRARVRDGAFRAAEEVTVVMEVTGPDGSHLSLTASPGGETGLYEAEYLPRLPGGYRVKARVTERDGSAAGQAETGWVLDLDADEHRSIRANPALMQEIARKTGGQVVSLRGLEAFARDLPRRGAPVVEPRTRPLWHGWLVFAAALACFAAEWTVRRRRGLA
jgi:hypothetical protein